MLIMAFLLLVTVLTIGKPIEGNVMNSDCDTAEVFLNRILVKKVKYEKDVFLNDSLHLDDDRKQYFDLVNILKNKKEFYLNCCKFILKYKSNDSTLVVYSYYPGYLNNTPECKYITYNQFILLVIYNLEHLKANEMELKCENSILK